MGSSGHGPVRLSCRLAPRPIDDIGRRDIVRLLDGIEDERGPVMANRALGIVGRIFNWHATRSDTFRSPDSARDEAD